MFFLSINQGWSLGQFMQFVVVVDEGPESLIGLTACLT